MLCHRARIALIDRELGALGPEGEAALSRHLERCAACRQEAGEGARLMADLALLREDAPPEIDVHARVMAEVATLGRPAADELSLRQWILAAAAAVFGVAVIGSGVWNLLPQLIEPARRAFALLTTAHRVASSLVAPLAALLAIPFKLLSSLASALWSLAPVLERLQPVGVSLAGLATIAMLTTVVYFVGRDLRARPLQHRL